MSTRDHGLRSHLAAETCQQPKPRHLGAQIFMEIIKDQVDEIEVVKVAEQIALARHPRTHAALARADISVNRSCSILVP